MEALIIVLLAVIVILVIVMVNGIKRNSVGYFQIDDYSDPDKYLYAVHIDRDPTTLHSKRYLIFKVTKKSH